MTHTWIETPQGRLFAKRWDNDAQPGAVPIVLFHDSLGSVALWRDFPERLGAATGRSVLAYDRLGFGKSDPNPSALAPSFVGDEAHGGFRAVREALGIDAFVAFGHSVGGGMAIACAAAYPDACRALITESAQAFVEDRTLEGIRQAKLSFAQAGQLDRLRKYHGDKAEWVLANWTQTWLAPSFADWSVDADVRRVRCPMLVIHGDGDEFGSLRHPARIAEHASAPCTVEILEGCGHVPHQQHAARVTALVASFLATNAR
jgi:pimeloyl-ACP methyl ester carboxylesterase